MKPNEFDGCLVDVPKADTRWWPDLFLKKGRKLLQVTPEQCGEIMERKRDDEAMRTGRGSSGVRDIPIHDIDGKRIGYVSFNGRVWLHDIDGKKEVPQKGFKTAAECAADGWK